MFIVGICFVIILLALLVIYKTKHSCKHEWYDPKPWGGLYEYCRKCGKSHYIGDLGGYS